jgi:hypothetical protein
MQVNNAPVLSSLHEDEGSSTKHSFFLKVKVATAVSPKT